MNTSSILNHPSSQIEPCFERIEIFYEKDKGKKPFSKTEAFMGDDSPGFNRKTGRKQFPRDGASAVSRLQPVFLYPMPGFSFSWDVCYAKRFHKTVGGCH